MQMISCRVILSELLTMRVILGIFGSFGVIVREETRPETDLVMVPETRVHATLLVNANDNFWGHLGSFELFQVISGHFGSFWIFRVILGHSERGNWPQNGTGPQNGEYTRY